MARAVGLLKPLVFGTGAGRRTNGAGTCRRTIGKGKPKRRIARLASKQKQRWSKIPEPLVIIQCCQKLETLRHTEWMALQGLCLLSPENLSAMIEQTKKLGTEFSRRLRSGAAVHTHSWCGAPSLPRIFFNDVDTVVAARKVLKTLQEARKSGSQKI